MRVRSLITAGFVCLIVLAQAAIAAAAEIRVLCAIAMQPLIVELGPMFERASGHKLTNTIATLGPSLKRVQDGETFDVIWIARAGIDTLAKDGKLVANTTTTIAVTQIGVAVRKGAPKPDISTPEAFKRALLAARAITHGNPKFGGLSGIHVAKVIEQLGITAEMKSRTVLLDKPGLAGVLVANGPADIVIQPIQELVPVAGIDVVGPLPDALQDTVAFPAAIMTGAKETDASNALISFLRSPEAVTMIKALGMQPG